MKIYAYTSHYTSELLGVYSSVESAKNNNPHLVFKLLGEDLYEAFEKDGKRDGYLQAWDVL